MAQNGVPPCGRKYDPLGRPLPYARREDLLELWCLTVDTRKRPYYKKPAVEFHGRFFVNLNV